MTTDQQRLSAIQADARKIIARANYNHCVSGGDYLAGAVMQSLAAAGFAITPKPEALSREDGEFDEAAAIRQFEEYADGDFDLSVGPTGQLVSMEAYCTRGGWLAHAEYSHADREALKAELTQARERIAELEAQLEPWALLMKSPYIHVVSASGFAGPNFEEMPANPDGYRRMVVAFYSRHDKRVDPGTMKYFIDYIDVMRTLTATAPIAQEKADG